MFKDRERETVRAISDISREFPHLEATLVNHEEPLARFLRTLDEQGLFGASFHDRVSRVAADRIHVGHLIRTYRAVATELRETNMALLETRQNDIMKTLTTITIIVLPLELTAFIFGMHALGTPLENNPNAFWIILTLMLVMVGFVTIFFARKRWIF
jgi:Mg2+ and Co2+ transporter CorA